MASLRLEVRACMSGLMSTYLHENRCIDVYIQKEVSCLSEIWREVLFCCFCCSKVLEFSCDSLIIMWTSLGCMYNVLGFMFFIYLLKCQRLVITFVLGNFHYLFFAMPESLRCSP